MDAVLQQCLDERTCRDVLARYGAALDWQDRATLQTVFWPDAEADYGFFSGSGAELMEVLLHIATLSQRRFHMMGGERVRVEGDVAHAESYMITQAIATTAAAGETRSSLFYGRFLDRLERRAGEWRIARRIYLQHGVYAGPYGEGEALGRMRNAESLNPEHALFRRL